MKKVFIANRGEIALRVQRACDRHGIASVIGLSEADSNSFTARNARELVIVGGPAPADSYLNIEKLIAAAVKSGCDALHPGYGFLSENAEFARKAIEAGLTFIGPLPETIRLLGSKTDARARLQQEGVPIAEGATSGLSDTDLIKRASEIGFPVIIKAVAGGGGRGMRVAGSKKELEELLPRARGEAKKFFSSDDVYLEKYIVNPRHVEVQIFGDTKGNVVHFGTRDCSAQRRHQKLIEEAPAPFLSEKLREEIHQAAVRAAAAVGYINAGTAEFLVSGDSFYFLEMNTRIQVEHPVTEMVARVKGRPLTEDGIDLVGLQLEVASGKPFDFTQKDISFSGHAIEFRVYAEDPSADFMPATGTVTEMCCPDYSYVREDKAYEEEDRVNVFYDAMMSKIIVIGDNRNDAVCKSRKVVDEYRLKGVDTTLDFHRWLLIQKPFIDGGLDIGFVERVCNSDEIKRSKNITYRHEKGPVRVERYYLQSESGGYEVEVEIRYRPDGLIHALPVLSGRKAAVECQRAAHCRDTLLAAMKNDVLEHFKFEELFV